ncbi:hypothetical protein SAY87_013266 [Trapa incisa]|uniref:Peptidase A1 domain-containing protein n=1 Tax=Trapa incisa TaxID=236973 RepID=A0AAN7K8F5_9MYRT|nr:hypothetical protein SAY87_013266 [Trapa incisa]
MDTRALLVGVAGLLMMCFSVASGNLAFQVHSKFKGRQRSLSAMREHDSRRHGRLLSADLPLGGNGSPSAIGLYFAQIGLGNPSRDFYVQVDTGSDILWVNCAGCDKCPTESELGIDLKPYDLNSSHSGKLVTCDQKFCAVATGKSVDTCKEDMLCQYSVVYGDGSTTSGYFVEDNIHLNQVSGNFHSSLTSANVKFGCAKKQTGDLGSSDGALSGLIGFGQANSSVLSQLASAGKVKKIFAHCLDSNRGGGIFTIGELVEPKVRTTPLAPNQSHYNIIMKGIEVGGEAVDLSSTPFGLFDRDKRAIVDSGTTLTYLPGYIYDSILSKITAKHPGLKLVTVEEQFTCFEYSKSLDDGFPAVKFEFAGSLYLTVYPHDYMFKISEIKWCFGWMRSTMQSKDGEDITLLGDLVISNKLVLYDLVDQTIGWVEYDCSSSVKVKDEKSGETYSVGAHALASGAALTTGRALTRLLSALAILYSFML